MIRQVGDIDYTLTQKPVKNINLRVRRDGTVCVSAHRRVPLTDVDAFVREKAAWIEAARRRAAEREAPESALSEAACLALLKPSATGFIRPLRHTCHISRKSA